MFSGFLLYEEHRPVIDGYQPYQPLQKERTGRFLLIFLTLFPLFGLICAGAVAFSIFQDIQQRYLLQQSGQQITATVVDKTISRSRRSTTYKLTYQFALISEGRGVYRNTETVSFDEYTRLNEGDTTSVIYLPSDPTIVRIVGHEKLEPLWVVGQVIFLLVWVGGFVGIPFLIMVRMHQQERKLTRLATHLGGQPLTGELRKLSSVISKGNLNITIQYAFTTPLGRRIEDKVSGTYNHLKNTPLPEIGTPVAIWYLDDMTYTIL